MTVTTRVLVQVFLVVLLGGKKVPDRLHRHCKGHSHFFLLHSENLPDRRELPLIRVVDAGPVLDPHIIPLPVYGQRVNHHEVVFEQFFQVHFFIVIVNPYGFCVSAVSADILVARRRVRPICVSGLCPDHSAKLVKDIPDFQIQDLSS